MHTFTKGTWASIYKKIIKRTYEQGEILGKSKTIDNLSFEINPDEVLILPEKNCWIWAFIELFDRLNPNYKNPGYSYQFRYHWRKKLNAEGGKFCYNYKDLIGNQLDTITEQLRTSRFSRQAVATVYRFEHLNNYKEFPRTPCTLTTHFYIKPKDTLNLTVNMRANDIINLLIYDVFHHSMLLRIIASRLNLKLGKYNHFSTLAYYQKKRETRGYIFKLLDRNFNSFKFGNYYNNEFAIELNNIIMSLENKEIYLSEIKNDFLHDFYNLSANQLFKTDLDKFRLSFFKKIMKIDRKDEDE